MPAVIRHLDIETARAVAITTHAPQNPRRFVSDAVTSCVREEFIPAASDFDDRGVCRCGCGFTRPAEGDGR